MTSFSSHSFPYGGSSAPGTPCLWPELQDVREQFCWAFTPRKEVKSRSRPAAPPLGRGVFCRHWGHGIHTCREERSGRWELSQFSLCFNIFTWMCPCQCCWCHQSPDHLWPCPASSDTPGRRRVRNAGAGAAASLGRSCRSTRCTPDPASPVTSSSPWWQRREAGGVADRPLLPLPPHLRLLFVCRLTFCSSGEEEKGC